MAVPINAWVPVPEIYSPNPKLAFATSTMKSFYSRNIRNIVDQSYSFGERRLLIPAGHVSVILGFTGEYFNCAKRVGGRGSAGELITRYSALEVTRYPAGYFITWTLLAGNLFTGGFEVFNGPEAILIN